MTTSKLTHLKNAIDNNLATWAWWLLAISAFILIQKVMGWMEIQYLETLFPATVIEGQTTFSGEKVKGFYAFMSEKGTLDKYLTVQIYDFLLMASMFTWLLCTCIASYRTFPSSNKMKNIAWVLMFILPLAPFFDVLENLVSFVMLSDPENFANWLAYPYSSFAVTKFLLSGLGFVWMTIGLISALVIGFIFLIKRDK